MTAAQIHIVGLQLVSLMLAAILTIAWRSFDHPRHALVWAIAFYTAVAAWSVNLLWRVATVDDAVMSSLTWALGCCFYALIACGFILRARPQLRIQPLITTSVAAGAAIGLITFFVPHHGLRSALWLIFAGAMMMISAAKVTPTFRGAATTERATVTMLILFGTIHFATAILAIGQGAVGNGPGVATFRMMLILLDPPAFIGVGLFTVFLVAVDLAERMRMLATSDLLTGIFNRRGFEEAADRAIRNAQRQRQPLAVVVSDIDSFKAINDRYGHAAGDRALQHFAGRLERMVRRGDLIGRIGGEEFALLLVNTRAQDAIEVVERIRRDIATVPVDGPSPIVMTASFGITGLRPGDIALGNLLARADRALYRSKMDGRDRVTSAEAIDDAPPPVEVATA